MGSSIEMSVHPIVDLAAKSPNSVMTIHYASQQIERDASITAIAVVHLDDFRTVSWSRQDHSEAELLRAFHQHVEHHARTLVGWNTSGPRFGYEALRVRAKQLCGLALPDRSQFDLDDVMERLFGPNYCPHPKLANMSERNALSMKDFLLGAVEADLGQAGDFAPLERSAERKARNIARLLLLATEGRLQAGTREPDIFWALQHPLTTHEARARFDAGQYADAVLAVMREINTRVKEFYQRVRGVELDGSDLMQKALTFTATVPPVVQVVPSLASETERNMQEGYRFMLAGAMMAIRNPKAHGNIVIDSRRAKLLLSCASLLLTKLEEGNVDVNPR